MTTTTRYTTDEEHQAGLDRLHELWDAPADTPEGIEADAIAKALQDYQDEHWWPKDIKNDGPIHFEMRLDVGFSTLDEVLSLFGGMDAFCKFMTREQRLDEETIERIITTLDMAPTREKLDRAFIDPPGWEWIEEFAEGSDWRLEMLAFRDAKAADEAEEAATATDGDAQDMQDDAAALEPELVAT